MSRRELLRLGGLGALAAGAAACRGAGLSGASLGVPSQPLPAFDPSLPTGRPTGLDRRVAWANTADNEIFVALGDGMHQAATERGLEYITANAAGDPAQNASQMHTFLARGVGSMCIQPLNQAAQAPIMNEAIRSGICVQGIITWPTVMQIAALQYQIGLNQGKAAADYATDHFGGRVDVCYLQQYDISPQLAVRRQGALDGLKMGGTGIRVVSSPSLQPANPIQAGYTATLSVIDAHPSIRAIIGEDGFVVGAYRALADVGKLREDMYLSGVDGDTNALDLIKEGTPYRASFAFPWTLMGYAMGRIASDWVEGRQIPRVMVAQAPALDSADDVKRYLADNAEPAAVFADETLLGSYLPMLGNVSYATRGPVWQDAYVP
ncbi:MAG TPA: sugar ABC transporter substrate-binding protein [Acidimicrobiales bacterium]|nr:sugar ABC transporter substrate-binding protein [Acidimicrobiales bacterium]